MCLSTYLAKWYPSCHHKYKRINPIIDCARTFYNPHFAREGWRVLRKVIIEQGIDFCQPPKIYFFIPNAFLASRFWLR